MNLYCKIQKARKIFTLHPYLIYVCLDLKDCFTKHVHRATKHPLCFIITLYIYSLSKICQITNLALLES